MEKNFQNNIVLSFGEPKTAIFAHIDSITQFLTTTTSLKLVALNLKMTSV